MFKPTKEQLYIMFGYVLFMIVFYFIGITGAQFASFVAIVLLTGFYAAMVWFAKKILG